MLALSINFVTFAVLPPAFNHICSMHKSYVFCRMILIDGGYVEIYFFAKNKVHNVYRPTGICIYLLYTIDTN